MPDTAIDKTKIWLKWNQLVNVGSFEIKYNKTLAFGSKEMNKLLRLLSKGRSVHGALRHWTKSDWTYALYQIETIEKLLKSRAPLIKKNGDKTEKYLKLLSLGHRPKMKEGIFIGSSQSSS